MSFQTPSNNLEDLKVHPKLMLAALWASFMFLYIYVDYFHLFMPGVLAEMLAGKVFIFEITQTFLLAALVSVSIPAIMFSYLSPCHQMQTERPISGCRWFIYHTPCSILREKFGFIWYLPQLWRLCCFA
jgi:hypothetical protein